MWCSFEPCVWDRKKGNWTKSFIQISDSPTSTFFSKMKSVQFHYKTVQKLLTLIRNERWNKTEKYPKCFQLKTISNLQKQAVALSFFVSVDSFFFAVVFGTSMSKVKFVRVRHMVYMCIYALFAIVSWIIWKCRHVFFLLKRLNCVPSANRFLSFWRCLAMSQNWILHRHDLISEQEKFRAKRHRSIPLTTQTSRTFAVWIRNEFYSGTEFFFPPVVLLSHTLQKFSNWTTSSLINIRWHFQFPVSHFSNREKKRRKPSLVSVWIGFTKNSSLDFRNQLIKGQKNF